MKRLRYFMTALRLASIHSFGICNQATQPLKHLQIFIFLSPAALFYTVPCAQASADEARVWLQASKVMLLCA